MSESDLRRLKLENACLSPQLTKVSCLCLVCAYLEPKLANNVGHSILVRAAEFRQRIRLSFSLKSGSICATGCSKPSNFADVKMMHWCLRQVESALDLTERTLDANGAPTESANSRREHGIST